jgi:hypothetical protein
MFNSMEREKTSENSLYNCPSEPITRLGAIKMKNNLQMLINMVKGGIFLSKSLPFTFFTTLCDDYVTHCTSNDIDGEMNKIIPKFSL